MVQVLPHVPGFGDRLGQVLGEALGDVGQGYAQGKVRKNAWEDFQKLNQPQQNVSNIADLQNQGGEAVNQGGVQGLQAQQSPINTALAYEKLITARGKPAADAWLAAQNIDRKIASKEAVDIRAEAREIGREKVKKTIAEDIGKRDQIRKERQDLNLGLNAVREGDIGGFDLDYLAKSFGAAGAPLLTAKGAQLDSAMKNLLIDSLKKTAGRPNQWIEQQIQTATPGIGKSREANETLFAIGLANLDIEEKLLDARDNLLANYEKQGVQPPSNLDQIAHQVVRPYAQQVEDKLSYDLRTLFEQSKGEKYLNSLQKVPQGTPLTLEKRDVLLKKFNGDRGKVIETAQQLGYTIPNPSVFKNNQE